MRIACFLLALAGVGACTRSTTVAPPAAVVASPPAAIEDVEEILRSDPELAGWLPEAERRRLQVLVAVPDEKGSLAESGFRVDAEYFYPASAVKLCAAFAALEKLGELRDVFGNEISPRTPLRFVTGQGRGRRMTTTTLQRDVEQAIVISDNDAFNRLLDFVGPEELAERLARRGISSAHIAHRLGDTSSWTAPTIELVLPNGSTQVVGERIGFSIPSAPAVKLGQGYRNERGRLIREPMDFSTKNAISLRELQAVLVGIARPDLTGRAADWEIAFRAVLLDALASHPSAVARYRPLAGAIEDALPDLDVRVFDKGGRAYGFAVENAYVVSAKTGRSFFVSAAIYANGNDIMNDDRYEYDAVANPFLTRLGIVLARHLLVPEPR